MKLLRNQFGVPQYPPGDVRRLLVLLAAIDLLERPTQTAVADLSGQSRETLDTDVGRLRKEFGISIHKIGEVYHIEAWGDLLIKNGVQRLLRGD